MELDSFKLDEIRGVTILGRIPELDSVGFCTKLPQNQLSLDQITPIATKINPAGNRVVCTLNYQAQEPTVSPKINPDCLPDPEPPTIYKEVKLLASAAAEGCSTNLLYGRSDIWESIFVWYYQSVFSQELYSANPKNLLNMAFPLEALPACTADVFTQIESLSPEEQKLLHYQLSQTMLRFNVLSTVTCAHNVRKMNIDDPRPVLAVLPQDIYPLFRGSSNQNPTQDTASIIDSWITQYLQEFEETREHSLFTPSIVPQKFINSGPISDIFTRLDRMHFGNPEIFDIRLCERAMYEGHHTFELTLFEIVKKSPLFVKKTPIAHEIIKRGKRILSNYADMLQKRTVEHDGVERIGNSLILHEDIARATNQRGPRIRNATKLAGLTARGNTRVLALDLDGTSFALRPELQFIGQVEHQEAPEYIVASYNINAIQNLAKLLNIPLTTEEAAILISLTGVNNELLKMELFEGTIRDLGDNVIKNLGEEHSEIVRNICTNLQNSGFDNFQRLIDSAQALVVITDMFVALQYVRQLTQTSEQQVLILSDEFFARIPFSIKIQRSLDGEAIETYARTLHYLHPERMVKTPETTALLRLTKALTLNYSDFHLGMQLNPTGWIFRDEHELNRRSIELQVLLEKHPEIQEGLEAAERLRKNRLLTIFSFLPFSSAIADLRKVPGFSGAIEKILNLITRSEGESTPDVGAIKAIITSLVGESLTLSLLPGYLPDALLQMYADKNRVQQMVTTLVTALRDPVDGLRTTPNIRREVIDYLNKIGSVNNFHERLFGNGKT